MVTSEWALRGRSTAPASTACDRHRQADRLDTKHSRLPNRPGDPPCQPAERHRCRTGQSSLCCFGRWRCGGRGALLAAPLAADSTPAVHASVQRRGSAASTVCVLKTAGVQRPDAHQMRLFVSPPKSHLPERAGDAEAAQHRIVF